MSEEVPVTFRCRRDLYLEVKRYALANRIAVYRAIQQLLAKGLGIKEVVEGEG